MAGLLESVVAFPGTASVLAEHRRALPQIDQLCGPFWARLALLVDDDRPARLPSEVAAAEAAGTQVYPDLDAEVRPAGVRAYRTGWERLPRAAGPGHAGTCARALAAAVSKLSAGRLEAVPVSSPSNPEHLDHLLAALSGETILIIANISTSALWGSHAEPAALDAFLRSGDDRIGPTPDWHVGHFVAIWGRIVGERGTLVAVADTYPSLGSDGLHLQPLPRLTQALSGRGLLIAGAPAAREQVHAAAHRAGLHIEFWD